MTNREKFTEIFGCEIAQHDNGEAIPGHCKILIASDRHFNDWLKQEYVPSAQLAQDLTNGCTDTISRVAAISICDNAIDLWNGQLGTGALVAVRDAIMALPSAQPERKMGKWIYNSPVTMKCDQCGFVIKDWNWHRFKFCPNCDCDMRGEQDG